MRVSEFLDVLGEQANNIIAELAGAAGPGKGQRKQEHSNGYANSSDIHKTPPETVRAGCASSSSGGHRAGREPCFHGRGARLHSAREITVVERLQLDGHIF